ncbi:50S ribosomal protein L33 domain protein, partial [Ostertagia ostertagi]
MLTRSCTECRKLMNINPSTKRNITTKRIIRLKRNTSTRMTDIATITMRIPIQMNRISAVKHRMRTSRRSIVVGHLRYPRYLRHFQLQPPMMILLKLSNQRFRLS